jgi:MFS family permease
MTAEAIEAGGSTDRRDRWRLGLVAFAVLLAAADTYVVVVALPSIMAGVGIGLDRLQRATPIISGFLLGYTAVLPLIGRLADVAGTDPVFAGCLTAFASGSVITATAHSLPVVVLGRALQGIGGGGLVPVALAIVASRWAPDARGLPLGIVGALQELGSVLGPLYGAGIVAVASWRAIFWVNVPVTVVVALGFTVARRRSAAVDPPSPRRSGGGGHDDGQTRLPAGTRIDIVGPVLGVTGAAAVILGLDAPARIANSATLGQVYTPFAGGQWAPFTTPVVIAGFGLLAAFGAWEVYAPLRVRPVFRLATLPGVLRRSDLPGAALAAGVLACIVVVFSTADPSKQVLASSAAVVGPLAVVLAVGFVIRERKARAPMVSFRTLSAAPAWGSLLVNLALGGGLMAALVDVPLFARATVDPNSEVAAALVLVRFLVAVPIGALAGGLLCRGRSLAPYVAAFGMAVATVSFVFMTGWSATALGGGPRPSDAELVVCGLGFGLAVAPLNVAILGAVRSGVHALASALAVVARTIGMLAGLSVLTAVALHRFYQAQAKIGSAILLCPTHPTSCPAYDHATTRAVITELHTIFAGAAVCTAAACVLALLFLRTHARDTAGASACATGT